MPLALVTGAGVRVGRAIALALAEDGYDVVVHAHRSAQAAEEVASQARAKGRRAFVELADLSLSDEVEALGRRVLQAHGALDVLVHSAADYAHVDFAQVTPGALRRMLAVNVEAPFLLTQALLPALRAAGKASVIHLTDMAVTRAYTPTHFFAHYLASKGALDALTRALAVELGPDIRVNAVAPGPVAMAQETTPAQRQDILAAVPLRREGSPADVAQAVVYLARAPYVTGQTLRVDGGLSVA